MLACLLVSSVLFVNLQNIQATSEAAENTWQTLRPLPEPLSGIAAAVGDKIYIFSGSRQDYIYRLFVYDTQNQTLNQLSAMPTYRTDFGVAVVDGKIYAIGGQGAPGQGPTNINEVYDTETATWETKQPVPDSHSIMIASAVDGKIYAIYEPYMSAYDPETDNWTRTTAPPDELFDHAGRLYSSAMDDKLYALQDSGQGEMFIYDTKTRNWSTAAPLPTVYESACMVATTGEHAPKRIYLMGGAIWHLSPFGDFEAINATFSYDPTSDSWIRAADMPTARQSAAVAVVDDKIYALGGGIQAYWLDPSQTDAVELYTPFGYVAEQPSASPSNGPESSQSDLPEATVVIVGVVVGAVVAGTVIVATAMIIYHRKHLKTAKQNKPN